MVVVYVAIYCIYLYIYYYQPVIYYYRLTGSQSSTGDRLTSGKLAEHQTAIGVLDLYSPSINRALDD